MFKKKTVLIVGAGASAEVGLPVGKVLQSHIAARLRSNTGHDDEMQHSLMEAMRLMAREKGESIDEWSVKADVIAQAMPLAPSIDNFLHTRRHDPVIVAIGKLAIAATILHAEAKSDLTVENGKPLNFADLDVRYETNRSFPDNPNVIVGRRSHHSWHNALFKMLNEGSQGDNLNDFFNNLSVITFNYDRCIEHYLTDALIIYMGVDRSEAEALLDSLPIFHPYGDVGKLPRRGETNTAFGATPTARELIAISEQIITFTEQRFEPELMKAIKNKLTDADTVVFLGFGYIQLNMQMFDVPTKVGRVARGTVYGRSKYDQLDIMQTLQNYLRISAARDDGVILDDTDCWSLLNDHQRELMAG